MYVKREVTFLTSRSWLVQCDRKLKDNDSIDQGITVFQCFEDEDTGSLYYLQRQRVI